MESLGPSSSGGHDSYVYVEYSDAETSDDFCRATGSTGDAEQHENYANASGQDLDQQWLEHQAHQNGSYADQFGYSQSSASGYSLRSEGGPAYTTDGQCAHQTQEFDPGQPFNPCQGPVLYAGDGSADPYSQYTAPAGHDDRGLGVTQPLYNFPDLRPPYLTYNPYTEDNNTMPARRNPDVRYPVGSPPAECRQGDRHKNLEQHLNQLMNVLNTPGIQGTTSRAHVPGSMSLDNKWGESSMDTLRPSGTRSRGLSARTRCATGTDSHNWQGQGQTSFVPPSYSAPRQQSAQGRSNPSRPAIYGTSRLSNHDGSHLHVPMSETSSFRPTSPGSSGPSDPLYCRLCSARFTGKYRQGNYGRHRRQKHGAETREYVCGATDCDRVFQRNDARVKHQRRRHPELFQVGA